MPEETRLLLVTRPALFSRCLRLLLDRKRHLRVVEEADCGPDALEKACRCQPDVAIVNPAVPGGGNELVNSLRREVEHCAILLLTDVVEDGGVASLVQAGARAVLQPDCEFGDLLQTIERMRNGDLIIRSSVADAVLRDLNKDTAADRGDSHLTPRELDVVRLVARGWANLQIAAKLGITENTVKGHLANIFTKLDLYNRVQLSGYAIQHGIIQVAELSS